MDTKISMVESADGTGVAWYDFGGSGPDLVLGHATGFNGLVWSPVVKHLVEHFHCYAYDVRGHGNSRRPSYGRDAWNWDHYGEDLEAVLRAAQLGSAFAVGHSSGGATEIIVEEKTPGTFAAMYLFEPVIFCDEPPLGPMPDRDLALRTLKRRTTFASKADAISNYSSKGPFQALDPAVLAAYVDSGFTETAAGIELRLRPEDEAEVYIMASAHDAYSKLQLIRCPVVVAHGETSMSFSSEDMRRVSSRIPKAEFMEFPSVGHFGPLEDPSKFAEAVIRYFSSL